MVERGSGAELAATWRDQDDRIVGQAFGGTMCWMPRKPWSLRIIAEDYTHVVPCGECPGCLEFYRRRLADRLKSKYQSGIVRDAAVRIGTGISGATTAASPSTSLFLVRIYAPLRDHAALSRKLHRRRGLELEPGFLRLGATSFAVLARDGGPVRLAIAALGLDCRVEALHLNRGRRAWRAATGGMLVRREVYGEQTNRFYLPGLPVAERGRWDVKTGAGQLGYDRRRSPRAWGRGNLVLVPPLVWILGRGDRSALRRRFNGADSPEAVRALTSEVYDLVARISQSSSQPAARSAVPGLPPAVEQLRVARKNVVADKPLPNPSSPPLPLLRGGGYVSSIHSHGAIGPPAAADPVVHFGIAPFRPKYAAAIPDDELTDLTDRQFRERQKRRAWDEQVDRVFKKIDGEQ